MDGLDGYLARKLNETSKFGSVFDILCDRVVEMVYWITFLALGWIPLWIPILIMTRGVLVDGFRAIAMEQGFTAFGDTSMMRSPLGAFLVSSRFSRCSYGTFKALAFSLLILAYIPGLPIRLAPFAMVCVYITVFFCLIRGVPVLIEAKRFFKTPSSN
jgi:CDP-diacylglycerol--glycerol-3-phosphate 3-phosphatidyltransferase